MKHHGYINHPINKWFAETSNDSPSGVWSAAYYRSKPDEIPDPADWQNAGWMLYDDAKCNSGTIYEYHNNAGKNSVQLFTKRERLPKPTPPNELQEQLNLCREMIEILNARTLHLEALVKMLVANTGR